MGLAVVRSIGALRRLVTAGEVEDFEQELVDQFSLALSGSGATDAYVAAERAYVVEFARFLSRPVWTAGPEDADRFLVWLRGHRLLSKKTVEAKAKTLARFYDFLIARYQGDVHALTGHVLVQPIDEYNRPASADFEAARVPPSEAEVESLFRAWARSLPDTRKYLPAARDYMAASLWRRVGLRINETRMLDMRDWRPDLGARGKFHVRFGKGSRGRGPKPRLVPAINSADKLIEWWLTDVRHQFDDDWRDPDAPLLPSERRDKMTGGHLRVGDGALRAGLAKAVELYLPSWSGRLSPHGLRHFCASDLYLHGMDLKALQDLLGHSWLSTTTRYIHVHEDHIERSWAEGNERSAGRLLVSAG